MHLIWATSEFKLLGVTYEGFPILLDAEMRGVAPFNEFMRWYLLRGAIGSEKSWPSTGRALYDFLSFLEAHELHWTSVERGEEPSLVAAYRDYSIKHVGLGVNTVLQRLIYICEFYKFALDRHWVDKLPFDYEIRRIPKKKGAMQHLDASGGTVQVEDVRPRKKKTLPQFLSIEEVRLLLAATTNPHHKMIIRFALQTGLRREEIATFPLAYVFDPDKRKDTSRNLRITLDPHDGRGIKTKGNKPRNIFISRNFMRDLWFYVLQVRGGRAQLEQQPTLFLNQDGLPFAGSGKGINDLVGEVGRKAGIRVWTHKLRHTYATHTLHFMQKGKRSVEPLVYLQRQLGHESIETTMIYAHLVHERADEAVLAYDDELNQITKEALDGQQA